MSIGQLLGDVAGGISGIGNAAGSIASRLGLTLDFFKQLKAAKFGTVSFATLETHAEFGRRVHVHEYTKRDTPWPEDLGRATRRFNVVGFLIGNDVISRREDLIALVEAPGPTKLVHPTFGELSVVVVNFAVLEHWEKGRFFEIQFSFVEAGERLFPSTPASTGYSINIAGASLDVSAAASFAKSALAGIAKYAKDAEGAITTATKFYATVQGITRDVRNAVRATSTLVGSFGRYVGTSSSTLAQAPAGVSAPATVEAALEDAISRRTAVESAGSAMLAAASALDATSLDAFSSSVQAVTASVLANSVDPSDAIRLLGVLAVFEPSAPTSSSAAGDALAAMQTATGALLRRAALSSLALAVASYQPESQDDALNMRSKVVALIDDEIDIAGDSEDDDAYAALRGLRSAVIQDLNSRGAALPSLKTFTLRASLPSLVLANQLYRDASRSDDLVAQAQPIHPAFMPLSFVALSE